ncbi:MAG: hypothetical protein HY868_16250 [Chloroflexi bacterium]|nr:hypothetical protein [Chloroflexota bacterium]
MPPFADLELVAQAAVLVGLVAGASIIVLIADWRVALFALTAQYLLATVVLDALLPFETAILRAISGALAVLVLYLTARQTRAYHANMFIIGFSFRLFALALVAASIFGIASSMTFLNLAPRVLFSGLFLIATGILVAILSRNVLRLGVGILLFNSGFCILETATESSLMLYGLLNIADLLLAVVVAHLAKISLDEGLERHRRGEAP